MTALPGPTWAPLARQAFRDARVRTVAFVYLFAVYSFIQPVGYRHTYPDAAARLAFARSFAHNTGTRFLYGQPHDIQVAAGYSAWRVGGVLAIAAALFGLFAAVRALRVEEESGRLETVLAGVVSRRGATAAAMTAIAGGVGLMWLAEFAGFVAGGLPVAGSAYLALATVSVAAVCVGIGAVACQVAATARGAIGLGGSVVAALVLARMIADTANGAAWLRWATPLGWAELMRPFADPRPAVLVLPALATAAALALAARLAAGRDLGAGVLPERRRRRGGTGAGVGSPVGVGVGADAGVGVGVGAHGGVTGGLGERLSGTLVGQALRTQRGMLLAWLVAVAMIMAVLGLVSSGISSADVPQSAQEQIAKLGVNAVVTPTGYLAFVFVFVAIAISALACALVDAARREETDRQLETLLAGPVGRVRWLAGRLSLAAATVAAVALASGLAAWAGACLAGTDITLPRMLEAGANTMPVALLFLGVAALAYAAAPGASGPLAYGLLTVAFFWQLVGALLEAPDWVVGLTPFAHIGIVPVEPFRTVPALGMVGIGLLTATLAATAFRHRDLRAS